MQNDFDIISTRNGFGLRADDHGDNNLAATTIAILADAFIASGLINTTADADVFKIVLPHATTLKLSAIPQNVGSGDDGANVDIQVTLLRDNDTINNYNPSTLLNAGVDTNLNAGTYYLVVDGVGNIYHNDVGSIGLYNITGTITTVLPVKNFNFNASVANERHQLSWALQMEEAIKEIVLESSADGQHFTALAAVNPSVQLYSYQPLGNETIYYRLKAVTTVGGQVYISNTISLKSRAAASGIQVVNNHPGSITIKSSNNFVYQLFTAGGQVLGSGKLFTGVNQLPVPAAKGLLLLHCSNGNQSFTKKLIQQ